MEYRLLGPLEVLDGSGQKLPLAGARQQSVLAALLLRAGQTVAVERLVDQLWEEPPLTAARTVQAYVSRLRKELRAGAIESRPGGYALLLNGDHLDLHAFEQAAEDGRAALASGDCERAAQLLRQALALWRGPALAGLASEALRREAERLEEQRLQVLEDRLEAELRVGRHRRVVPELRALIDEHPFRERPRAQLMLALYRSGRSGEALAMYRETRSLFNEEIGMEPGEELRALERAILRDDPALQAALGQEGAEGAAEQPTVTVPAGTITFLFTDIEGSTALAKRLRDRYGELLEQHQLLLRAAFEGHEGLEIDTQGDSFFFAFARAKDAVVAVVEAQRALTAHGWPEGDEVHVRMGLHTGEPTVGEHGYTGFGVHRGARIAAAGHGGQVLLSNATRELVEDDLPDGVGVRNLGTYQLKDVDRSEHLFQLTIDGLPSEFPPLKAPKVAEPHPLRRRAILLAALAGVIAAAVAIAIFAIGQGGGGSIEAASGNSVGFLDPASNRLVANVDVGATPTHVAVGEGAVWVTNADDRSVSRIDPVKPALVQTITVGNGPSGIIVGNGAVWVANSLDGTVSRIDPATNEVVQPIAVGNRPLGIAYAAGSVWVANTGDSTISRIDADSGRVKKTLQIAATELAFGAATLWASQRAVNQVARIDPKTNKLAAAPITVGNGPSAIAFGDGAAWVVNTLDGTVSRIDPDTNSVETIGVGNGPAAVAVGLDAVWVSNEFGGTAAQIDPRKNQLVGQLRVGNRPQGVAIAGGNVLVAVRHSGPSHRGGTLRMRMNAPPGEKLIDSIDTARAYLPTSLPILRMTGDGLVAFRQASGLAGTQLVPDLAVSLPPPIDGGRTYAFRLRKGIRYSNGRRVKASDFRATFERDFRIGTPTTYYDGIVGAPRCRRIPKRCNLSRGIVADDAARSVTFHLREPDPEFLYKLALGFAYVVPAGTPPHEVGTRPLPATGPYRIANYRPKQGLKLVRNRYFHEWSQAAQPDGYPDEILLRSGGTIDQAIRDVIRGKADLLFLSGQLSQGQRAELETRYASQVHTNPLTATHSLFLNTRVAPFNRLDVRRALNYGADRAAALQAYGGPNAAQPTCQILPPGFPGYRPYCPYSAGSSARGRWTRPNLTKARALVARSGTRGMRVTVWGSTETRGYTQFAVKLLRSLGYRVSTKVFDAFPTYQHAIEDSGNKAQIGFTGWGADYPAASTFFGPLFSCESFVPESPQNLSDSEFCDADVDGLIEQASREQATNPAAARVLWERVDREIVDQAPYVPLHNPKVFDVLSKRVGNYQYSASGVGMLIDQLWVR
jgi:YVTN family beta-propeller protein